MIEIKKPVCFDVDDTLVMWNSVRPNIKIVDETGYEGYYKVNQENVEAIKFRHEEGDTVIVWSHGGIEWAKKVVLALGLSKYVDVVADKPYIYYDDLDASKWMTRMYGRHVYHKPEDAKKVDYNEEEE